MIIWRAYNVITREEPAHFKKLSSLATHIGAVEGSIRNKLQKVQHPKKIIYKQWLIEKIHVH